MISFSRRWLLLSDVCMMVALLALTEAEALKGSVPKPVLLAGASVYLLVTAGLLYFMRKPAQIQGSRSALGRGGPVALAYVPRAVLGLILLAWVFFER